MNTPTPEQIAKLPKWAQDYIRALRHQLSDAVGTLDDAAPSDVFYTEPVSFRYRPLPPGSSVTFTPNVSKQPGNYLDIRVSKERISHRDGSTLSIQGAHHLTVSPRAANVVWVTGDDIDEIRRATKQEAQ